MIPASKDRHPRLVAFDGMYLSSMDVVVVRKGEARAVRLEERDQRQIDGWLIMLDWNVWRNGFEFSVHDMRKAQRMPVMRFEQRSIPIADRTFPTLDAAITYAMMKG